MFCFVVLCVARSVPLSAFSLFHTTLARGFVFFIFETADISDAADHGGERAATGPSVGAADASVVRRLVPVRPQPDQGVCRRRMVDARSCGTGHHREVRTKNHLEHCLRMRCGTGAVEL